MSSPFDGARDGNVGTGYAFGDESDVMAQDAGAMSSEALRVADNRLNEEDYRS